MTERTIRSFTEMLGLLNRGRLVDRLDEEMAAVLNALRETPKESGKATLSLTLTIAYQEGRLDIRPEIKAKLPAAAAFNGTPFWELDGGLSVQHPSQSDMFSGPRSIDERDRARG